MDLIIPERTVDRLAHCAGDRLSSYPVHLGHLHFVAQPSDKRLLFGKECVIEKPSLCLFVLRRGLCRDV